MAATSLGARGKGLTAELKGCADSPEACRQAAKDAFASSGGKEEDFERTLRAGAAEEAIDKRRACAEAKKGGDTARDCDQETRDAFVAAGGDEDDFKRAEKEGADRAVGFVQGPPTRQLSSDDAEFSSSQREY